MGYPHKKTTRDEVTVIYGRPERHPVTRELTGGTVWSMETIGSTIEFNLTERCAREIIAERGFTPDDTFTCWRPRYRG